MMKRYILGLIGLAIGAGALLALVGCGNNTAAPTPGKTASAAVTIQWPTARLIPTAAQSIKITVSDAGGFTTSQIAARPSSGTTSTNTFTNLPVGTLTVTATAYPQAGATGTPQATGTSTVVTQAGAQASLTLTMASTIDHLDITSSGLSVAAGGTLQLTATPKDVAGNVVLVSTGNITWSSASTSIATVGSTTGLVTGIAAGSAIITATESDSLKSKSVTVMVTAANTAPTASFTVTPASGSTSTVFAVDASSSTDLEDAATALQVRWDWDSNGTWTAFSTTKTATHSYAAAGAHTITLEVKDTGGLTKTTTKSVTVTNPGATLTVAIDASLSTGGTAKISSITKGELLATSGTVVANATINAGAAKFDMAGLSAGIYFIRLNDLADDLIPTKLDSTATNVSQFVGTTLVNSIIGTIASPNYQIKTFSKGQGRHMVAAYSSGVNATPERYAYVMLSLKSSPQMIETRVLGTGTLLSSHEPVEHSFPSWILGSSGHGTKSSSTCTGCHGNLDNKPASHGSISQSNGWCFKCHYGKTGTATGLVDPAQ